jgi:putative ABC transport system ATP-binding protein
MHSKNLSRRGPAPVVGDEDLSGRPNPVTALNDVSFARPAGTFTAVMGPSGSGKSTLLQCAAGLDQPDDGCVFVGGDEIPRGREAEVTRLGVSASASSSSNTT